MYICLLLNKTLLLLIITKNNMQYTFSQICLDIFSPIAFHALQLGNEMQMNENI
jgi:hypothetical protein